MKFVKVCLVVAGLSLFALACAGPASDTVNKSQPAAPPSAPAATATPDVLAAAQTNYDKHCTSCHGDTGEGGLVKVDDKKIKVPSLTKGHALTHTDQQLAKQIANGDEEMPAFKDKLSAAEIDGLVNYIRKQLQKK
jgi:mono/diheme cytochrome c family protein